MQVFPESRPVALADVDCVGNETSLLDCPSQTSPGRVLVRAQCANSTDATILACGNTDSGAFAWQYLPLIVVLSCSPEYIQFCHCKVTIDVLHGEIGKCMSPPRSGKAFQS